MTSRALKAVVGPALFWTCLVGSAFVGIGGMGLQGASDAEIRYLWIWGGIFAAMTFLIAIIVFSVRCNDIDP
jgi:hypothetical protein